ncbi:ER membrane protein complex subunit 1 [Dermacentor andersoni]|uniref:ER membrane protein complex subunit 1 n=1 Tax=Dermacentor andersoni TaxID=34620 RepID=UPI0021551089|nr:ER membrane protein complex subunit 1-like [Dermacentor andersoni]
MKGSTYQMLSRLLLAILVAISTVRLSEFGAYALYEDQAGKLDWRQRFIGKPLYVYADHGSVGPNQRIVVATEKNVLASLNTRNGALTWRQVLEQDGSMHAVSSSGDLITVSGNAPYVRAWDVHTGVLQWEKTLPHSSAPLVRYDVNSHASELTTVEVYPGQHVVATVYNLRNGEMKTSPLVSAPWITDRTDCRLVEHKYLACLDTVVSTIRVMALGESAAFRDVPLSSLGIQLDDPTAAPVLQPIEGPTQAHEDSYLALRMPDRGFALLRITKTGVRLAQMFPNATHLISMGDGWQGARKSLGNTAGGTRDELPCMGVVERLQNGISKIFVYELVDGNWHQKEDYEGQFAIPPTMAQATSIHLLPFLLKDLKPAYKTLVITEDDAVLLFHQQGRLLWTREEALASVLAAQFIDLPLSETDAKIEQEFGDGNANVLAMFLTRITMQLCQLQSLLLGLFASLSGTIGQPEAGVTSRDLTRDKFGFNKVILLSTAAQKLFALNNRNGQIVWSQHFPQLHPLNCAGTKKLPIFVQRTTAHYPHPPRCTVLGKHSSGNGYLVSVNPITGVILDTQELPYHIQQTSSLPFLDDEYTRGLLFLDSKLGVHTYPSSAKKLVYEHRDTQYLFTADPVTGNLVGYSLRPSTPTRLAVETVWAVSVQSEGQNITHIVMRNPLEHVHSQGRVMGDRSVLYKYLNPNLVAVVTEGTDNVHKVTSVTVHLIDVITGAFVYSGSHKRARGPVHIVHTENWIVYCYHNEKSRRAEISVIELYEGAVQSNTSAFSSFNSPPGAIVEHQSYVFPSSIDAMVDTVTEKGITSKHVLLALPSGAILELPKALLDPRRPITPTALHREEGLVPYMPELPINAEHIVNYNQSVARVAGFATAASGLESTCLVVAYGLDIFYTRVAPSKTFDILKDDFDHVLISVVLTILILVSYISKRFSARKALRAAWK